MLDLDNRQLIEYDGISQKDRARGGVSYLVHENKVEGLISWNVYQEDC